MNYGFMTLLRSEQTEHEIKVLVELFQKLVGARGETPVALRRVRKPLHSRAQEGRKTINELFFVGNPRRGFPATATKGRCCKKKEKILSDNPSVKTDPFTQRRHKNKDTSLSDVSL